MSRVDYDTFLEWATNRFGAENIKVHKDEIRTHSVFTEDQKYHLWMNPSGGKSKHPEYGSYRCWYTDRMGSLVSLVAQVDHIPYEEAEELICGVSSLRALEKKLEEFYGYKVEEEISPDILVNDGLELPPFSFKIADLPKYDIDRVKAETYLTERKLPIDDLYICTGGDYKHRIIIPYYDQTGRIVYYNARTLSKNPNILRYKKPDNDAYRQEDVLFMRKWPRPGSKVYITEGEFDAVTLNIAGFFGAGCGGKNVSDAQCEILRHYIPVLAFDTDEGKKRDSGGEALVYIGAKLLSRGFTDVFYVRPPKKYKDWNKLLEVSNKELVRSYIEKYEKRFDALSIKLTKI